MEENINKENIISPYIRGNDWLPIRRIAPKMNRNQFCKIENKKFKKCCGKKGINFCEKIIDHLLNNSDNS